MEREEKKRLNLQPINLTLVFLLNFFVFSLKQLIFIRATYPLPCGSEPHSSEGRRFLLGTEDGAFLTCTASFLSRII